LISPDFSPTYFICASRTPGTLYESGQHPVLKLRVDRVGFDLREQISETLDQRPAVIFHAEVSNCTDATSHNTDNTCFPAALCVEIFPGKTALL
jgi:hypothetical protein